MPDPVNNAPIKSTMSTTSDYILSVVGGVFSRISPTNVATIINDLLDVAATGVKVRHTTGGGSILTTDRVVTTDGTYTLVMPSPSASYDATNTRSNVYTIAQKGAGTITIDPYSGESFYNGDGSAESSYALSGGVNVSFVTDGTDWIVVGS